jgi:hypothetical protein
MLRYGNLESYDNKKEPLAGSSTKERIAIIWN